MKYLYTILFFALFVLSASAQMYEKAVGIRTGYSKGIFFDKENDDLSTTRFMMSTRDGGRHFTVLKYFRKYDYGSLPEFISVYYGYGGHAGYVRWWQRYSEDRGYYAIKKTAPVVGVDILVGVSYDFEKLPISLTLDTKPYFDIWGEKTFNVGYDFALGAIYSF